jgi:hypothetical protein
VIYPKRPLLIVFCACVLLTGTSCAPQRRPIPGQPPLAADVADAVLAHFELERLMARVEQLTAPRFQGRDAGTAGEDLAGDYLVGELQAIGLQPWVAGGLDKFRQSFSVRGRKQPGENIVAHLPGQSGNSLLVVSAHYDHLGIQNGVYYPGADDNAVGVATLLEVAECLSSSSLTPERTVLFALLSGEEKGLVGAANLARWLQRQGYAQDSVVLNLDMLGGIGGNSLDIWLEKSRPSGQLLATVAQQEIEAAGITARRIRRRFGPVDSAPFAKRGMPSITLSWDLERANHPYRHTPNDTYANLRHELVEQASRGAIRVALALSNLLR